MIRFASRHLALPLAAVLLNVQARDWWGGFVAALALCDVTRDIIEWLVVGREAA